MARRATSSRVPGSSNKCVAPGTIFSFFSDESFFLVKTLEAKYDMSVIHHYEVALVPSSEFTTSDILGGLVEFDSTFDLEDNISIEYDPI